MFSNKLSSWGGNGPVLIEKNLKNYCNVSSTLDLLYNKTKAACNVCTFPKEFGQPLTQVFFFQLNPRSALLSFPFYISPENVHVIFFALFLDAFTTWVKKIRHCVKYSSSKYWFQLKSYPQAYEWFRKQDDIPIYARTLKDAYSIHFHSRLKLHSGIPVSLWPICFVDQQNGTIWHL